MTDDLGAKLQAIWDDQRAFNLLLRQPPQDAAEMAEQARDFVLWTEDELHELLRAMPWKKHRRTVVTHNPAHMHEEGIDAFKLLISLLQLIGIESLEQLIEVYWRKTAVVRQRYQEEWVTKLDGTCVIIDIDNVLCDYVTGICSWLSQQGIVGYTPGLLQRIDHLRDTGQYVNAASLGLPMDTWQDLKHRFRIEGVKRRLPVFQDAWMFLERMRMDGHRIVLLTSRPVDRYPNIFTDTILWLNENRLPYDFVWWSLDKAERIAQIRDLQPRVRFAIDDDPVFVKQFASIGIKTYWLQRHARRMEDFATAADHDIITVTSLTNVDQD